MRQLKINQAREMLISQARQITVTQVAIECGFTNFSLFAKYYKEQFNELPSQTLKNIE